jgi:aminopeptidase N
MAWDEKRFGREYDLDVFNIVAVSDFNLGAMENKGLNVFNERLILASPDTATDAIFEAIESVVAHEYFHNWTGNRITCRDWFQLCLKEGLTVFRDQEFSADERSATVQRITDVRQLRAYQFPEDQGPLAHPVRPDSYIEINNFYTATVYEKGAELVRMIRTIVGEAAFRAGMDLYFDRHDGEAATVDQFVACFAESSGRDLSQFMLWYAQAGTPELVCTLEHDEAKRTATLAVEQVLAPTPGQPKKKPLHVPVRLGLLGRDGQPLPLKLANGQELIDGILNVTKRSENFRFVDIDDLPVASLLREFSAPVRLTMERRDDDLSFLMAHDTDHFNRWQAANDYATRLLIQAVKKRGDAPDGVDTYAQALGRALDADLEPAYLAELLKLPSESDIARDMARNIDPDAIHLARRAVVKRLATALGSRLEALYERMSVRAPFSADAASAGRRALRNACLTLLSTRGGRGDQARLAGHYDHATNMTDQSHALTLLAARSGDLRKSALDDFYSRWSGDTVVIDTWFTAQAIAPLPATLNRVKALLKHPLFSLTAPNKVRSLIYAFAMLNPVQFNRPDGGGYRLVADQVLAIDAFNPQVAARLAGCFRSWRGLEAGRRKLVKAELQRMAKTPDLSRDLFEIVSKSLEAPERIG